jgi:hypothetical protein
MNILEFKKMIDSFVERESDYRLENLRVCVPIETVGSIGGTRCSDIKRIANGFDWDQGKLMLYTEDKLMLENPDTLGKLREECKEMGWTRYEIENLKRENKRLLKEIKKLRGE